ncbi:tail assembly protein [Edwardsiella piscicida]|uniref:tail assembly protein n=1 Tax=Edwardsiella piscicida TaxID=1263550 RepID=UPI00370DE095
MATANALNMEAPGLASIRFHGDLQRFGSRFDLHVNTAAEGIRALCIQLPGLRQQMSQGHYQVRIAGLTATPADVAQRMREPLPYGGIVHIVPRAAGAKRGGVFQIIAGVAMIAVAWWNPAGWMGAAAVSGLYAAGASMALGGVAQMLAPQPKAPSMAQADNGKQSTYFSSLDNMVAQGNPLPVLYGEMLIGSRRISQMLSTRDEGGGGKVVVIGRRT